MSDVPNVIVHGVTASDVTDVDIPDVDIPDVIIADAQDASGIINASNTESDDILVVDLTDDDIVIDMQNVDLKTPSTSAIERVRVGEFEPEKATESRPLEREDEDDSAGSGPQPQPQSQPVPEVAEAVIEPVLTQAEVDRQLLKAYYAGRRKAKAAWSARSRQKMSTLTRPCWDVSSTPDVLSAPDVSSTSNASSTPDVLSTPERNPEEIDLQKYVDERISTLLAEKKRKRQLRKEILSRKETGGSIDVSLSSKEPSARLRERETSSVTPAGLVQSTLSRRSRPESSVIASNFGLISSSSNETNRGVSKASSTFSNRDKLFSETLVETDSAINQAGGRQQDPWQHGFARSEGSHRRRST